MPTNLTATAVADVRELASAGLPVDVRTIAVSCLLDWFGVAIAGASEPAVGALFAETPLVANGPCALIGRRERTTPVAAALLNGVAGDALDYSDTNRALHGHATATVVPAALAQAELQHADGTTLLRAIVAGVEMACRVGRLVGEGVLGTGFHPTAVAGPLGAAAAAAYLLELEPGAWITALGIAATQAAGLSDAAGTMCKPLHAGAAASAGLLAARLAARGFTATTTALEPDGAFLRSHSAAIDADALERARGRYLIRETLLKEHAACQLTHGSIDNVRALQREHDLAVDAIASMRFEIAASSAAICDIREPRTGLEARFSLRTVVAMALLGHDTAMPDGYDAAVRSPEVAALRARASVSGKAELDVPISRAWITLADGRVLERSCDERETVPAAGERALRASRKFHRLTAARIDRNVADALEAAILGLEGLERVGTLTDLATPPA